MRNKGYLLTCLLLSGVFVAVAGTGGASFVRHESVQRQAEIWLNGHGVHVGWDQQRGQCATIGVSSFDCPKELSDKEFYALREKTFFLAYVKMIEEQLGALRQHKIGEENVRSGMLDGTEAATPLSSIFKDIMRPWESEIFFFFWRTKSLSDDDGNDCPLNERLITVKSENASRLDGSVQGLGRLRYFESRDKKDALYEVAMAGIQVPSQSLKTMQDFVKGALEGEKMGNASFDDWLSSQGAATLAGVQSWRDKDGNVWVVGFAPILGDDLPKAKQRARFWAAFAFGARVQVEKLLVQGRDFSSFYGDRQSLDASESVVGESYPEDMVQYRRLQGRCVAAGRRPVDVVACILRPGTRDFRATNFQRKVQGQVANDFIAGRKKSLYGLREAIMRRMETLTGPENAHRRKGLSEALEKLNQELKKLEDGASDEVSPLSP